MGLFGLGKKPVRPLRLLAQTADDLQALAPLLQDAVLLAGDISYDPQGRHLTLTMSRYCHERVGTQALRAPSVLRINGVVALKRRTASPPDARTALSLLDVSFDSGDEPAGVLILHFAGNDQHDIRMDVECVDILLLDLAAPRRAKTAPDHS
ncbi:MAG: DUF2948 family protein [Asticcacaulis sp.]